VAEGADAPLKTLTTLYEVLGVGPSADTDTLRKAYRVLARKHHPDVSADPLANDHMVRINEAFEVLIDPMRRMEYDASIAGGTLSAEKIRRRTQPKPIVVKLLHRLKGHLTPVYAVAFAPDTGQVISSAFDNEILWWDEDSQRSVRRSKLDSGVISTLRAFAGGRLVAAGSAETMLSFWEFQGAQVESWRTGNEEWVSCLSISPDGRTVAAGSIHRTLAVSDAGGKGLYRRHEHSDSVTAVAWSADGTVLATGSADATVKLWNAKSGTTISTIYSIRSTVTAMAFSPDSKYLAVAAVDLSIRVFRLSDGVLVKMMFGHTKPIEALAFHPNGWLFASGSRDGTVGLWNAAKGIGNVRIESSSRPISCVAFSPDGMRLAAGGQDKTVRLWEVAVKEGAERLNEE
jgi:WD40 repeat protein